MNNNPKPFNQTTHNKYDRPAREATKKYIKRHGYTAEDNPDIYGADLIVKDLCYVECEVKKYWSQSTYPYPHVRLPYRKKKFSLLDMPTVFYIWNNKYSHAVRIPGSSLGTAEVKEYKNSQVSKGELFYWFSPKTLEIIKA